MDIELNYIFSKPNQSKPAIPLPYTAKKLVAMGFYPVPGDTIPFLQLHALEQSLLQGTRSSPKFIAVTKREIDLTGRIVSITAVDKAKNS